MGDPRASLSRDRRRFPLRRGVPATLPGPAPAQPCAPLPRAALATFVRASSCLLAYSFGAVDLPPPLLCTASTPARPWGRATSPLAVSCLPSPQAARAIGVRRIPWRWLFQGARDGVPAASGGHRARVGSPRPFRDPRSRRAGARPWQPVIHQQQVDTMRLFDGETGSAPAGWSQEPRTVMPPPFVHSTGRRAARRRPGTAAANTHSANGKTTWATQFSGHSEPSSRARSEGPSRGLCAALRQGGACGSGATPRRRHHPGPESGPWSRDVPRCGVASSTAWSRSSRVGTRFGSPRRRVLR